jgi:hypothetical protein
VALKTDRGRSAAANTFGGQNARARLYDRLLLNTPRAVEVSVYVVRAFVKLRELVGSHLELARRLDDLEQKTEALAINHDTFSRNTRNQLKDVFDALRQLMTPPDPPKRHIGFINPNDSGKKTQALFPSRFSSNPMSET